MFYMLCAALKARPKGFLLIIILLAAGSVLWKIAFVLVSHLKTVTISLKRTKVTPSAVEIQEFTSSLYELEEPFSEYLVRVQFQGEPISTLNKRNYFKKPIKPLIELSNSNNLTTLVDYRNNTINLLQDFYMNSNKSLTKLQKEWHFLVAVLFTQIMNQTMDFLANNDLISGSKHEQAKLLHGIWFNSQQTDSNKSGFEQIFLNPQNWFYFAEEQRLKHLYYNGYNIKLSLGKKNQFVAEISFTYQNMTEYHHIMLIGVSPELEMSLYTLCFLIHPDSVCLIQLGNINLKLIVTKQSFKKQKINAIEKATWII